MINNFGIITRLLHFERGGDFYLIEIIKRRKDNPDMDKSEVLLKKYHVYNIDEFNKISTEIKELCTSNKARAYIRLNVRNDEGVAFETNRLISTYLYNRDYKSIAKAYDRAVGRCNSETYKKWIVDIDNKDQYDNIVNLINKLHDEVRLMPYSIISVISTINGYHLITNPFDTSKFKEKFPDVDIHKDNGTLLYANLNDCKTIESAYKELQEVDIRSYIEKLAEDKDRIDDIVDENIF